MASSQVSSKKRCVIFADPPRSRQTQTRATSRNLRSSPEENPIAAASSPYKGVTSTNSFKCRPTHFTRSIPAEVRHKVAISSTLTHLLEACQAEISLANKHEHHVPGKKFCYFNTAPDQDFTIDQSSNPLYDYKATSDPDSMYQK